MNNKNFYTDKKTIGTTWLTGNSSCTLVIPKTLAEEYGLDKPPNVIIHGKPEGILITKLKLGNNDCPNCRVNRMYQNGSGGLAAKQIPLDPTANMLVRKRHDDLVVGSTCLTGSESHES